jgi:protein-S-isoprenylcysteine O-methyltransferase Ste14
VSDDRQRRSDHRTLRFAFILAVQIVPCILLVLIGWGFDDLPGFFLNPARVGLTVIALAAAVAVVGYSLDLHPLRKGSTPVGNQSLQLAVLLLLSLLLLWFLPFADRRRNLTINHDSWRYFGLLLCVIGVSVRVLALKALGKYFSAYVTLQPDHRLVRRGIYDCVRHPLYLSLLLLPPGVALVFSSFLTLPIFLLAATFVLDRIRKEDDLLAAHFGSEFESYRHTTKTLIPLLF